HITLAGLAVHAGLRGHRPLALPREPRPQRFTNLDHRHLPEHHPGDLQPLDWRRSNRDDAGQAAHHAAGPATGDRVVPCSWRKTPQPGPMPLADDTPWRDFDQASYFPIRVFCAPQAELEWIDS